MSSLPAPSANTASNTVVSSVYQPRRIEARPINGPILASRSRLVPVLEKHPNQLMGRAPSTITYRGTANIEFLDLLAQSNGGLELELVKGKGLREPEYSNPLDASEEMLDHGAVDVLAGTGHLKQKNNLNLDLLVTVANVPLAAGVTSPENPDSVTSETPHGQFAMKVASGGTREFSRTLNDELLGFLEQFPGQKPEDQKNFVYPSGTNPEYMHVTMEPASAVTYFYERLPEVKANPKQLSLAGMKPDALGSVYAPKELMSKALEQANEINEKIVYTDLRHDKTRISFSLPFEDKITATGESRSRPKLGTAFRDLPMYEQFLSSRVASLNAAAASGSSRLAARAGAGSISSVDAARMKKFDNIPAFKNLTTQDKEFLLTMKPMLKIDYEIKLPYYKVHKNWTYKV